MNGPKRSALTKVPTETKASIDANIFLITDVGYRPAGDPWPVSMKLAK
ncbi:MAG: hypothetical protein JRM85_04350 [Nitrososphaerota archaeon]|nr:hypothetical protein [Nitrososphaerota archaeon]